MTGGVRIAQERTRQRVVLGWTPEHDDHHDRGELIVAAGAYLTGACTRMTVTPNLGAEPICAPEEDDDVDSCLVKAGALIAAELDRRERRRARALARLEADEEAAP